MINLTTYEQRSLQFEVDIQGIDYDKLEGSLRFIIEDIEYGFPVKISSKNISVDIIPLQEVIKKRLKNNQIVKCKLEVYGDGFYLNPWNGEFQLEAEAPLVEVKTPIVDNKDSKSIKVKAEPMQEIKVKEPKIKEKLDIPEKDDDREIIIDEEDEAKCGCDNSKHHKQEVKDLVKDKISSMLGLLKENKKQKKPIIKQRQPSEQIKKTQKTTILEKKSLRQHAIDKQDINLLLESVGMKSDKIQEMMIEKARLLSGTDDNEALFDTLDKMIDLKPKDM